MFGAGRYIQIEMELSCILIPIVFLLNVMGIFVVDMKIMEIAYIKYVLTVCIFLRESMLRSPFTVRICQ